MSTEETPEETIKQFQFRLAAAENALQKNVATTMLGAQVLQDLVEELTEGIEAAKVLVEKLKRELIAKRATSSLLRRQSEQLMKAKDLVKELNAEKEAAQILVEKLKRELIAETATSSQLKRENKQLMKPKRKTKAKKQVKASSIECQRSGWKPELRMAMRTSWVKFRLVIRSWKRMVERERRRAMRSRWPKFRLVCKCMAELEGRMAMRSSWLKFKLVVDSWLRIARETKLSGPVHWPDTDDEFD